MKKKWLATLLAVARIFSLLPGAAWATEVDASSICGDNLTWTLEDGVLTIQGAGSMFDYGSSESQPWYSRNSEITTVVLGDGVTGIGQRAFSDCVNLSAVTIPGSVATIKAWAFSNCYSLTGVTIPSSVTEIECYAFNICTSLTDIDVARGNPAYRSVDGVLFDASLTLLHTYPAGKDGPYCIPASVTMIGDGAFNGASRLTGVTIPDGVTGIGRWAFSNCGSLNNLSIPSSVVGIGSAAFLGSGLKTVSYAGTREQWEAIPIGVENEPLVSAEITYSSEPAPVIVDETLPKWNFLVAIFRSVNADCYDLSGALSHINYTMTPKEVDFIKKLAKTFERYMNELGVMYAQVGFIEIDETVTELTKTDHGSMLTAEQAAPFLEAVGVDLDQYDEIACAVSLTVQTYYGITSSPFANGTGHMCINYVNEETTLDDFNPALPGAIYFHEYLHFIEFMAKKWGTEFDLHGIVENLYPSVTDEWKVCYTDIIRNRVEDTTYGSGVSSVVWQYPPHVIRTARELTIPSGVTGIGYAAFYQCGNLESVTIPSSVTSIGDHAFRECSSLKNVTISSSVTSIGEGTFFNCTELTSVCIPASVTSVGYAAFWNTGLTEVYYGGTQAQWNAVQFDEFNDSLTGANIHYNSTVFSDVPANIWYGSAVSWAEDKGYVAGTGNGMFTPDRNCTEAEILTFLWNAEGKPEAAAAPITVPAWAQGSVDWAYEKGLIDGSFQPYDQCTRATTVYYLWLILGKEQPTAGVSFPDVDSSARYADAVAWAVGLNIVKGTGNGIYAPDTVCSRAMIATFLHRAYVPEART